MASPAGARARMPARTPKVIPSGVPAVNVTIAETARNPKGIPTGAPAVAAETVRNPRVIPSDVPAVAAETARAPKVVPSGAPAVVVETARNPKVIQSGVPAVSVKTAETTRSGAKSAPTAVGGEAAAAVVAARMTPREASSPLISIARKRDRSNPKTGLPKRSLARPVVEPGASPRTRTMGRRLLPIMTAVVGRAANRTMVRMTKAARRPAVRRQVGRKPVAKRPNEPRALKNPPRRAARRAAGGIRNAIPRLTQETVVLRARRRAVAVAPRARKGLRTPMSCFPRSERFLSPPRRKSPPPKKRG